jgi:GNAT superfamily N-acetyltransferase
VRALPETNSSSRWTTGSAPLATDWSGSVVDDATAALAVAGFRVGDNLAWGHHLYIDDLSTLPAARQQGHAAALLAWLHEEAERLRCDQVHLDSGVGTNRVSAHRLYFDLGYRISSHHFCRDV